MPRQTYETTVRLTHELIYSIRTYTSIHIHICTHNIYISIIIPHKHIRCVTASMHKKKLENLDHLLIIFTVFGNVFTLLELSITYFFNFSTFVRKKISKNRKNVVCNSSLIEQFTHLNTLLSFEPYESKINRVFFYFCQF